MEGMWSRAKSMHRVLPSLCGSFLIYLRWLWGTRWWQIESWKASLLRKLEDIYLLVDPSYGKEPSSLGFISTFWGTGRFFLISVSEAPKRVKTKEARDGDNFQIKSLTPICWFRRLSHNPLSPALLFYAEKSCPGLSRHKFCGARWLLYNQRGKEGSLRKWIRNYPWESTGKALEGTHATEEP